MRAIAVALATFAVSANAVDPIAEQIIDTATSKISIDTSHASDVSGKGKIFFWFEGFPVVVDIPLGSPIPSIGQACAVAIDFSMLTNQTCEVVHAVSTDTERPMFDIAKYQGCMNDPLITDKNKCTVSPYWVSAGGRVAVGTPCDPQLIRGSGAAEYRKTTNGTVTGAAGCRCTAGSGFKSVPKESLTVYRKRYPYKDISPEDAAICTAGFAQPPAAPTSYNFCISTDDGGRLKVDGATLINNWVEQNEKQVCGAITLVPGDHTIVAQMFDSGGNAAFHVSLNGKIIVPVNGWDCGYYNSSFFTGPNAEPTGTPVLKRTEPKLDFAYGTGSPAPGINPDNFSVNCLATIRLP